MPPLIPSSRPLVSATRLLPPLIAAALLASCSNAPPPPPSSPPAVEVQTVVFRPVRQWDDFTGRIEAVQNVELRPRVGGYIDSIHFAEGGRVHRGQLLYQIDPRPFAAEVARLRAELQRAEASAVEAKAEGERGKRLIGQNAIARSEFDKVDAAAKVAAADVASARATLQAAELNLSFTHVTAPIDGRISKTLITQGNLVTTSSVLTTIVSDNPIYAAFNADEQAYLRYASHERGKRGAAYIGLATEVGYPHKGELHFLDNALDPGSGTIVARAQLDNADGKLTPGLFARVRLLATKTDIVALLPEDALGTDLGKRYVFVVDRVNHVQYRGVTLGAAVGDLRIIKAGLNPGDRVVVEGLQKVKAGDAVTPMAAKNAITPAELAQLAPNS